MSETHEHAQFSGVGTNRRVFMRRSAAKAFLAPLITSFALEGIAVADNADPSRERCGSQSYGQPRQ